VPTPRGPSKTLRSILSRRLAEEAAAPPPSGAKPPRKKRKRPGAQQKGKTVPPLLPRALSSHRLDAFPETIQCPGAE
jgi:hypothetical protein